ncbi:protein kinase [Pendulispora brunnea]|uniref:Protein kinase n=2 Tax=Pendulispora brunnea TaxID=2905690 RepID=A0ABZ2JZ79_9BACT
MGVVLRAYDCTAERTVALKVLHKTGASALRRFAIEADALGKLDHPGIVRYLAHGVSEDGAPYLALEWLEGESLRERLERAAKQSEYLDLGKVVALGERVAGALAAAHAIGIVHRDVKPSNILLVNGDLCRAKLLDFGIVRAPFAEHDTTSGTVLGTVGYMAPEQARGAEDVDGRADLFSLGCVLFRCLANREVFDGPDPATVLSMLLLHKPPRLSELRPGVPPQLDDLVARLLARERENRPASASDVKRSLAQIGSELLGETQASGRLEPPQPLALKIDAPPLTTARRPLWIGASAFAVLVLAIGITLRPWRRATDSAAAVPLQVAPSPAPTSLTSLPASPSCDPRAVALYQQGLQGMHDGRWSEAKVDFRRAAELDGACPQVQLRRISTAWEQSTSLSTRRRYLRETLRLRDGLSDRDRMVVQAFELLLTGDVPRLEDTLRVFQEAVNRYPMDAELRQMLASEKMTIARSRAELEDALEDARKAAEIDPSYSDAWQTQSRILERLDRDDESRAMLDQCIAVSPGSVDCMQVRSFAMSLAGQCEDAVAELRRASSWDPEQSGIYRALAEALAATGAPKETIEQVLVMRNDRLPVEGRDETRLLERAQLEAWAGQFDAAIDTAQELERHVASSASRGSHWAAAIIASGSLSESGDAAGAARVATQALLRKGAWPPDSTRSLPEAPAEGWLLGAKFRGQRDKLAEWHKAVSAWERSNEGFLDAFERWGLKWGPMMDAPIDPREVLAEAPSGSPSEGARHYHVSWRVGVLDAYAGHIYLQAGDIAHAMPFLERGAHACQGFDYPFLKTRAHLWLGMAKEKLGDTDAACSAYRAVLDRWGHATPRSVTAREAERRSHALGCK